jgi:hypothetical protein
MCSSGVVSELSILPGRHSVMISSCTWELEVKVGCNLFHCSIYQLMKIPYPSASQATQYRKSKIKIAGASTKTTVQAQQEKNKKQLEAFSAAIARRRGDKEVQTVFELPISMDINTVSGGAAVTGTLRSAPCLANLHIRVRLARAKMAMLNTVNARAVKQCISDICFRMTAVVASLGERVLPRIYSQAPFLARKNIPIL